jgi:hypothetical protein
VQECGKPQCIVKKLLAFYTKVVALYQAEWIVKVDDSVYMTPQRLMLAIPQWRAMGAEYVGCMKRGIIIPDRFGPKRRFDRDHVLMGIGHMLNAHSSAFVVHAAVVEDAIVPNAQHLRILSNPGALSCTDFCRLQRHFHSLLRPEQTLCYQMDMPPLACFASTAMLESRASCMLGAHEGDADAARSSLPFFLSKAVALHAIHTSHKQSQQICSKA